jgi:hypothetical protein
MSATYPVYIKFDNSSPVRYYRIEATQVKRTLKNKLIKVKKPLSKNNQDGSNTPETLLIDLKKIDDMVTVMGYVSVQDTSSTPSGTIAPTFTDTTQKNSIDVFEDMVADFKKVPGPYTLFYKGKEYTVLIDQLEHTDRSNRIQTSTVNSVKTENFPQRVDIAISFTIGSVR